MESGVIFGKILNILSRSDEHDKREDHEEP